MQHDSILKMPRASTSCSAKMESWSGSGLLIFSHTGRCHILTEVQKHSEFTCRATCDTAGSLWVDDGAVEAKQAKRSSHMRLPTVDSVDPEFVLDPRYGHYKVEGSCCHWICPCLSCLRKRSLCC